MDSNTSIKNIDIWFDSTDNTQLENIQKKLLQSMKFQFLKIIMPNIEDHTNEIVIAQMTETPKSLNLP